MIGLLQPNRLAAAVKSLHSRSSLEIHKLLKDSDDFCICYNPGEEEESPQKINVEKMVEMLPQHLMAVLVTADKDEKYEYLLRGIRVLQTFCDLTPRHTKLEQVLLDDVKLSGLMLDFVFLVLIALGGHRKESRSSDYSTLLDATVVASSLYLLHGIISPNYQDLVQVLLAHPKVDVFIDSAFGAVHNVLRSLRGKVMYGRIDLRPRVVSSKAVEAIIVHCQQAEAALQFLLSLCQHKQFRDRVAESKELCGNGGVLMLAQSILSLTVVVEFVRAPAISPCVSRMKAKVLSLLQHLFEAESVSFLDEVARAGNIQLARIVAAEVLGILRGGLSNATKASAPFEYPMGFVLLNALRLADVLTDDSNCRRFFTEHFSMVLSAVFCLSHGDFLSLLCSSDLPKREDDATLDYDLFTSAGWVLSDILPGSQVAVPQFKLNLQNNLTMSSYAHQRTSLIVKIMANLHCFVPEVCHETDRNRFIGNFVSGLRKDPSSILANILPYSSYTPEAQRGTGVCKNLRSLLRHAQSLIPTALDNEDFVIFRVFYDQLEPLICSEFKDCQAQDIQGAGWNSSGKQLRKEPLNLNDVEALENSDIRVEGAAATTKQGVNEELELAERLKESDLDGSNLETSGSDSSSNRGKSMVDRAGDGELVHKGSASGEVKESERADGYLVFETQRKKRKRSIMNDDQMAMIEKALAVEPEMQRNSVWVQHWADKLSQNGPEVITSSQLKNWLNNRRAKLARANKNSGLVRDNNSSGDLAESPGDENSWQQKPAIPFIDLAAASSEGLKQGQQVMLVDERGGEIGRGMVLKTDGEWYGLSLEARRVCVVDVMELSVSYDWSKMSIPYGSDDVGRTFGEANSRFGVMRVAWDVNKLRYQTV
ncbi:unnamed protein product [Microthlaspi erraticum]|uniref:Homeobox domain-containing protein n=1 Tax=Microthlaspi erraticum TaxID=1685480 RepID=A0A6D2KH65_9BRAS|nr:unnamed protein product [Microthlaspi erraticum]